MKKRYVVEISRNGYREVEAESYDDAEGAAYDLNASDGVEWSDFVDVIRAWEKAYAGKRWGDLLPDDRSFLLSEHSLTDADAWANGEHKTFTGNGRCFIDLNAEGCYISGIVDNGEIFISDDAIIMEVY